MNVRKKISYKEVNMRKAMRNIYVLLLSLFLVVLCSTEKTVFRFARHYANHMVLQRAPYVPVLWGFGEENTPVIVSVAGKEYRSTVKTDFRGLNIWKVYLDPFPPGGPYKITATSFLEEEIVTKSLLDVYFGDVWVCGGQSNMVFTTKMSFQGTEEINQTSAYRKVRLFTVARYAADKPVAELEEKNILQQWAIASKDSVGGKDWMYFSAMCWMYGRRLYDQYSIPIGLISSNYGGTRVEAWSSLQTIARCNGSMHENKPAPPSDDPFKYMQLDIDKNGNSVLWNAMIYPLLNTTIFGVIWYQGSSNANYRADLYNCTFPAMIDGWRNEWFDGTSGSTKSLFPFGFAQLYPFCQETEDFPKIRWKQTAEYGYVPNSRQLNVFMAVAMDLPDPDSPYQCIHPRDKTDVAERLTLGARAVAYGENIYWTGPIAHLATKEDSKIRVTFKPRSLDKKGIEIRSKEGFEVKYGNGTWRGVLISSWKSNEVSLFVKSPDNVRKVRYAWKNTPCDFKKCAIYTKGTNLPSGPFELDV